MIKINTSFSPARPEVLETIEGTTLKQTGLPGSPRVEVARLRNCSRDGATGRIATASRLYRLLLKIIERHNAQKIDDSPGR